jgi:hypothetical protein
VVLTATRRKRLFRPIPFPQRRGKRTRQKAKPKRRGTRKGDALLVGTVNNLLLRYHITAEVDLVMMIWTTERVIVTVPDLMILPI